VFIWLGQKILLLVRAGHLISIHENLGDCVRQSQQPHSVEIVNVLAESLRREGRPCKTASLRIWAHATLVGSM